MVFCSKFVLEFRIPKNCKMKWVSIKLLLIISISIGSLPIVNSKWSVVTFNGSISVTGSERSPFKESFPKDISVNAHNVAIRKIEQKVSSLEEGLEDINDGLESLRTKTKDAESALSAQNQLLQKLDSGFQEMEKVLSSHNDIMDELTDMLGPNDNTFAASNQTCGGTLYAESGFIMYSRAKYMITEYEPFRCIWIVNAGHHSLIRIKVHSLRLPSHYGACMVELLGEKNKSSHWPSKIKQSKLDLGSEAMIQGPLAFLVLSMKPEALSVPSGYISSTSIPSTSDAIVVPMYIDLHLEYEGKGKMKHKRTQFFHMNLPINVSHVTNNGLEIWRDNSLQNPNDEYEYTQDLTVISVSNLTTKARFKLELQTCTNGSSFQIIPDLLAEGNNTFITDCCKANCSSWNTGSIIYGSPMVFMISKPLSESLPFNFSLEADIRYRSNFNDTDQDSKCGGVLGGTKGTLTYRADSINGIAKCVWIIQPQPTNRGYITITSIRHNLYTLIRRGLGSLFIMELADVNGTDYEVTTPKTTSIPILSWGSPSDEWHFNSREVYIVFQSDAPSTIYSRHYFTLEWYLEGAPVKTGSESTQRYSVLNSNEKTGTLVSSSDTSPFPILYDVFVLTQLPESTLFSHLIPLSYELTLEVGQQSLHSGVNSSTTGCLDVTAYSTLTTAFGDLQKNEGQLRCQSGGNNSFTITTNGIAVIVLKKPHENISLDYRWTKANSSTIITQSDQCGGVLKGNSGIINYKHGRRYEGNERCIWLIQSPNCSAIKLNLLSSGFFGDRYLVANTIDPATGKLRDNKEHVILNLQTRLRIIREEVVVLLFQTVNGTTSGNGFSLHFKGLSCLTPTSDLLSSSSSSAEVSIGSSNVIRYHLHHFNDSHFNFEYKETIESSQNSGEHIHVIAFSHHVASYEHIYQDSTVVEWENSLLLRNRENCTYDTIRFYSCLEDDNSPFLDRTPIWVERLKYPSLTDTATCPLSVEVTGNPQAFQSEFLAFLGIYKTVPSPQQYDEDGDELMRRVSFTAKLVNKGVGRERRDGKRLL